MYFKVMVNSILDCIKDNISNNQWPASTHPYLGGLNKG